MRQRAVFFSAVFQVGKPDEMASDHWAWATPRPAYMREIEPLAHPSAWHSPDQKPQASSVLAYRAMTNERMREAEEHRIDSAKLQRARAAAVRKRLESLELNSKRKGVREQPERQTA